MLKEGAVPSVFPASDDPLESGESRAERAAKRQKVRFGKNENIKLEGLDNEGANSANELHNSMQRSHEYREKVLVCRLCQYVAPNGSMWINHYSDCKR